MGGGEGLTFLYVLLQNVNEYNPGDCGIKVCLGDYVTILEVYHWSHHRITLIESVGSWGVEGRLKAWRELPLPNLIAWEKVS